MNAVRVRASRPEGRHGQRRLVLHAEFGNSHPVAHSHGMVLSSLVFLRPFAVRLPLAGAMLTLTLSGCTASGPAPGPAPKTASAAHPSATAGTAPGRVPGRLVRAEVDEALSHGPPWLLRRVVTEEVLRNGKFVGWRLLAVPKEWTVDLKPGDIVKTVNGTTLERPDDLFVAWTALAAAPELKVLYERDAAPREMLLPIDGAPSKQALLPAAPKREHEGGIRKGTVVIEDDTPPVGESSTEY